MFQSIIASLCPLGLFLVCSFGMPLTLDCRSCDNDGFIGFNYNKFHHRILFTVIAVPLLQLYRTNRAESMVRSWGWGEKEGNHSVRQVDQAEEVHGIISISGNRKKFVLFIFHLLFLKKVETTKDGNLDSTKPSETK